MVFLVHSYKKWTLIETTYFTDTSDEDSANSKPNSPTPPTRSRRALGKLSRSNELYNNLNRSLIMPLTTRKLGNSTDSYTNGNSSNSPLKKPSKYSYSRQNSTRSRRNSRSQSPKSRNGSADSNASKKSEYIRTNSPRYGKGWGFGKDSAKSTRSTRYDFT